MLGIGFAEMVLIGGIALIVIGPEKFPDFAKLVVRTIRDLRGYVDDVKNEVSRELKPLQEEVNSLSRMDPEKYIDSLTSEAPASKRENPALHEEDRKVMDEAGMYDEDACGWEGDDEFSGDTAPDETVGYGEADATDTAPAETAQYGEEAAGADSAPAETAEYGEEAVGADIPPAEDRSEAEPDTGNTGTTGDPNYESFENIAPDGDNEPDVWTGR